MGLLKKVFKPVAKVLDKIVPNEVKPFLPYAAAFAPVFGPTAGIFGDTMMKRALLSGGANILGQLSQEGSEGDINLLSAGLGALTGAMTTPGAAGDFRAMKTFDGRTIADIGEGTIAGQATGLEKLKNFGLESLAKGSDILRPGGGLPDLFSKEGLKAATIPAATATGDVMQAEARRLEKQAAIDAALAEAEALADSGLRGDAIRNAMRAYGFFTDEEIEDTVSSAGYKAGGRVGFDRGGLGALGRMMAPKEESKYITKKSDTSETDTINRIYEEQGSDGLSAYLDRNPDLKDKYVIVADGMSGELTIMPNKLHPDFMDTENIIMLKSGDGGNIIDMSGMFENKAKGGRVGYRFGGIDAAIDKVEDESIKESMKFASDIGDMDIPMVDLVEDFEIIFKRKPSSLDELKQFYRDFYEYKGPGENIKMKEKIKEKVVMEAKDGGIMKAKRGLVNEPGGYAGELGPPLDNRIEGFGKKMVDEFLQGNLPEFKGERVSDYYNRPNFTDVNAVLKIIEMGGSFDDVRNVLNIDISDERIKDFIRFDQENKARDEGSMKDGGLMNLGGKEMDLRGGGFVPIGKKERADDVPARLSKNEFVMTADAVRAAGGGSVNKGAKRMYELMNNLEARV